MEYKQSKLIYSCGTDDVDICVVIPTYKRINLLNIALNSVYKQKENSLSFCVKIISNDPDFDYESIDFKEKSNLFIYKNLCNIGMVGNINQCCNMATGKYTCFLQDDDLLMPNYFFEIEKILLNNKYNSFDCLIPNRYFLLQNSFPEKIYVKSLFASFFKIFNKTKLKTVNVYDCLNLSYNIFGGGPTCGILFKTECLKNAKPFSDKFPYVFDYVFFSEFSEKNKVVLLDKYISIYRIANNASYRLDVQYDFFLGNKYLETKYGNKSKTFMKYKRENEIFDFECHSIECQQKLMSEGYKIPKKTFKYYIFRLNRMIRIFSKKMYRRKTISQTKYEKIIGGVRNGY